MSQTQAVKIDQETKATLTDLAVTLLVSHPKNPRLLLREDVIESIARQLKIDGVFQSMHAPIVRAVNGSYEIVSGHHRVEAARKAKMKEIPCWIADLSDEDSFMMLVLSNAQSELTPLEVGIHALEAIELGIGGKGKKGGLSEYAERIGKAKGYISEIRDAAKVFKALEQTVLLRERLLDKAKHLSAIHAADEKLWPLLVKQMFKHSWTVADTEHWVTQVKQFKIDELWQEIFLPLEEVITYFLDTKEFSFATVKKLVTLAEQIEAMIDTYAEVADVTDIRATFRAWLAKGKSKYSWDFRQLIKRQQELVIELEAKEVEANRRWNCGDWRAFIETLDDGSVALLLSDPPYGINFQSDYKLDRREPRRHKEIANDTQIKATQEIREMLAAFYPKLARDAHVLLFTHPSTEPAVRSILTKAGLSVRSCLVWVKNNTGMGDPTTTFAPQHERILHAVKGSPVLFRRESDVRFADRVVSTDHPNEKPIELLIPLIEATTVEGGLVADPFAGVASSLVAARKSKRAWWGCEINETYHATGKNRLLEDGTRRTACNPS